MNFGARMLSVMLGAVLVVPSCGSDSAQKDSARSSTRPQAGHSDVSKRVPSIRAADCGQLAKAFDANTQNKITSSRMRCGTMKVPVDHYAPGGHEISIAFGRFVATGPKSEQLGTLIVNPGGPGRSGIQFLASGISEFPAELTSRFDIVAFDPRGVGASTSLQCLTLAIVAQGLTSDSKGNSKRAAGVRKDAARRLRTCQKKVKELVAHIGTDQVVADLEDLRVALGGEPLNFYGMSYGTTIAAGYVSTYPDHVRAVVLDGSMPPDRSLTTRVLGQFKGITRALASFVAYCEATTTCALNPDPEAQITAVIRKFRKGKTLPAARRGEKAFADADLETAMTTALYAPSMWDATAEAIVALGGTDLPRRALAVKVLSKLVAFQTGKRSDGTYDSTLAVRSAVACADADTGISKSDATALAKKVADIIRGTALDGPVAASSYSGACTQPRTRSRLRIGQSGLGTQVLVIGNTKDPVTPIEFAHSMAHALGDVPLITYGGNGHMAGLRIECVKRQLTDFFVTGGASFVPQDCPADPNEFDLFSQAGAAFDRAGTDPALKNCVVEQLRKTVTPLQLLGDYIDQKSTPIADAFQTITKTCAEAPAGP